MYIVRLLTFHPFYTRVVAFTALQGGTGKWEGCKDQPRSFYLLLKEHNKEQNNMLNVVHIRFN